MKQEMLRKSIITAAMTASLGLTACGGGGGDTPPPPNVNPPPASVTLSGKVADGYIIGATVCLDLNNNKVCDPGEPSTVTSTGGTYAFDATQVDIDTYPIVVEVPGDGSAYDEDDNGAPIANNYVLTAPAGQGTTEVMVTPLTTMVQNEIENNPTLTAAEAETAVLSSMGVTDSTVSLFDDYVAESDATTNTTNAE